MSELLKNLDSKSLLIVITLVLFGGLGGMNIFTMKENVALIQSEIQHMKEAFAKDLQDVGEDINQIKQILNNQQMLNERILKLEIKVENLEEP